MRSLDWRRNAAFSFRYAHRPLWIGQFSAAHARLQYLATVHPWHTGRGLSLPQLQQVPASGLLAAVAAALAAALAAACAALAAFLSYQHCSLCSGQCSS